MFGVPGRVCFPINSFWNVYVLGVCMCVHLIHLKGKVIVHVDTYWGFDLWLSQRQLMHAYVCLCMCVYVWVWVDVYMSVWTTQQWSPQKHGYILYKSQDSSFLETDMVLSLAQLGNLVWPCSAPRASGELRLRSLRLSPLLYCPSYTKVPLMVAALPSAFKVFGCPMQPLCPKEAKQRAHCSSDTSHPIGNKSQGEVMRHSKTFHSSVLQINGPQLGILDEYLVLLFFFFTPIRS